MGKALLYAFLGTLFCFIMTTLGSAMVFLTQKHKSIKIQSLTLGLSSGVMLAASIWSLILPSLDYAYLDKNLRFSYTIIGLILGYLLLALIDFFSPECKAEENYKKKSRLLFLSITIHNIPEGMAVGLSIALSLLSNNVITFVGAMMLALGVGIQNFPEGSSVSLPYYQQGYSKKNAFLYGMYSGIVEPIFGVLVVFIVQPMTQIMPLLLSFAAGTMIYVVVHELIPEAYKEEKFSMGTLGFMLGFLIMMSLDVLLG